MSTSLWDDVPDLPEPEVAAASKWTDRTVPEFRTYGPGDGRSWHEYFEQMRLARKAQMESVEDDTEYEITITQEAEEFDDPCGPLAAYVKLLHSNGWEIVSLSHALAFARGKPFKSGANEGKPRPDQNMDTQWVHARKTDAKRVAVTYTIVNGTVRGTSTSRRMNGIAYGDKELKERIKDA